MTSRQNSSLEGCKGVSDATGNDLYAAEVHEDDKDYALVLALYDAALRLARRVNEVLRAAVERLRRPQHSDAAQELIKLHEGEPRVARYASDQLVDRYGIAALDEAYQELLKQRRVVKASAIVSVRGNPRSTFIYSTP